MYFSGKNNKINSKLLKKKFKYIPASHHVLIKINKLFKVNSTKLKGYLKFTHLNRKFKNTIIVNYLEFLNILLFFIYKTKLKHLINTKKKKQTYDFLLNNYETNPLLAFYYLNKYNFLNSYNIILNKFIEKSPLIKFNKFNHFNTIINKFKLLNKNKTTKTTKTTKLLNLIVSKKMKKYQHIYFINDVLYHFPYSKLHFNHNTTLRVKRNSNIFITTTTHQITSDFFSLAENSLQFKNFEITQQINLFKINIYNLSQITSYFNWGETFISLFPSYLNNKLIFSKLHYYFYNNLALNSNYLNTPNNTILTKNSITYNYNSTLLSDFKNFYNYKTFKYQKKNLAKNTDYGLFFNLFEFFNFFFSNPIFFKSLIYNMQLDNYLNKLDLYLSKKYNFFIKKTILYSKNIKWFLNNLSINDEFNYIFNKNLLKIFDYSKLESSTAHWHYQMLIRFIEHISGKKVYFRIHPFLQNTLTFIEKIRCLVWSQKVKYFRRVLGPRLFLNESLQIIYLSLKLHDPFLLSNWIASILKKISFWKSKTYLRYIKYVLKHFFWAHFNQIDVRGIKFQLKGKISVAGNSRTRASFHTIGYTSHSNFNNKILFNLNLFRTFTGIQGLKLWIVF